MLSDKENIILDFTSERRCFPIPSEHQETNPTIFDIAMLGKIPELGNHKPEEQDKDGWTVATILLF